jgi:uncharacterized protein YciI
MTPQEAAAMQRHGAYWKGHADKGTAIAFGPVADPKGGWGVGIVAVESDDELLRLQKDDPAVRANIEMRYEAYPMPTVTVGRGA